MINRIKFILNKMKNQYIIFSIIMTFLMLGYYYVLNKFGLYLLSNDYGGDFINQHIPLVEYIRKMYSTYGITAQFFPNLGLGQGIAYYVYYGAFSPIMFVFVLFKNINVNILFQLLQIIIVISSIVLGATFIDLYRNDKKASLVLSSLVICSGALLSFTYNNYMFIYPLPFLFLTLIGIKKESSLLYVLGLTSIFYVNFMYSHIALIVIISYVLLWEIKSLKKIFIFCVKYYFIVLLLSLPILTTQIPIILSGARTSDVIIEFTHLNRYFLRTMFVDKFTYAQPIVPIFIILGGLVARTKKTVITSMFILLLFISNDFNYLLNVFQYIEYRHIMMFTPVMLLLLNEVNTKLSLKCQIIILSISTAVSFNIVIKNLWGSIYKQNYDYGEVIYVVIFIIFAVIIMQFITLFSKERKLAYTILFVFLVFLLNNNLQSDTSINYYNINECTDDNSLRTAKIISANNELKSNYIDNQCNYSTDAYFSLMNYNVLNLYNDIYGIPKKYSKGKNIYYQDRVHNKLLSVGRTIDENNNVDTLEYEVSPIFYYTDDPIYNDSILYTYDNLLASKYLLNGFYSNNSELKYEKEFEMITYNEIEEYEYEYEEPYESRLILDDLPDDGVIGIEIVLDANSCDATSIAIEGVLNTKTRCTYTYYNGNTQFNYWIEASELKDGVDYTLMNKGKIVSVSYIHITEEELELSYNEIENISFDGKMFQFSVESDGGYVLTTIPYDDNFSAIINGKKVEIEKVNGGYVGFKIEEGKSDIQLKYKTKYLLESFIISCITLLIGVAFYIRKYKNTNRRYI